MDTNKYKSRSIYVEHIKDAEKQNKTINEYISFLKSTIKEFKTVETDQHTSDIQDLKEAVKSLSEAIGYQRYMIDTQTKNQNNKIDSLIDTQEKLINAYAGDIEFIKELKKMVMKGE